MYKLLIFIIILSSFACLTPSVEPPVYSRELARIGDIVLKEDVLRFRLRLEMAKYPEDYFKPSGNKIIDDPNLKELIDSVLDKLITDYTIIAYGKMKGIEISQKDISRKIEERKKEWNPKAFENFLNERNIPYSRWRQLVEDEIRVQDIMQRELENDIKVSINEISNYYYKNRNDFDIPERIRVRQIVTDTLEKANDMHERLLAGANFANMAINHSLSPDRARGGDLGYFSRGSYPKEFDEVCFKLNKGEISPVVKSPYGYHIFKLLDKKPAGRKSLEEVAPKIQQLLFEEKLKEKYDPWIANVRSQVKVTIDKDILENFIL